MLNQHQPCPFNNVKDTRAFLLLINTHVLSQSYRVDIVGFKNYISPLQMILPGTFMSFQPILFPYTLNMLPKMPESVCAPWSPQCGAVPTRATLSLLSVLLLSSARLCSQTPTWMAGWLVGVQLIENMEWENDRSSTNHTTNIHYWERGRVARDKGARRRRPAGAGEALGLRKRDEGEVTGELTKSEESRRGKEWKRDGPVNPGRDPGAGAVSLIAL